MNPKIVIELIGGPMDGHRMNIITNDHDIISRCQDEIMLRLPGCIKIPKVDSKQSLQAYGAEYYFPRPHTALTGNGTDKLPLRYYHETYKSKEQR